MNVAIIARSTLYAVPGGDTIQALQTALQLSGLGIRTDVRLTNEVINYGDYDLLHFFNISRPADILYHSNRSGKLFVVSTILCNYAEFDKYHRRLASRFLKYLPGDSIEYLKTMARWLMGKDQLSSLSYLWKGQRNSIIEILQRAAMILPNSESEYKRVAEKYDRQSKYMVVPNGVNPNFFPYDPASKKNERLVLCVARIEGIKNQLNLIKALNDTPFTLLLIGAPAPNQGGYYDLCRSLAAPNVRFIDHVPHQEIARYYQEAKVHILPSWFETTGLSSIEAAVMGCNIIITDKGDAKEYFRDQALYCDPGNPESIRKAVCQAAGMDLNPSLRERILREYTWKEAALQTRKAYELTLQS